MRISFTILLVVSCSFLCRAQKINIGVSNVKNFDPYFDVNAQRIYRLAIDQISAAERFTLLERRFFEAIEKEKERQKSESFIDGEIAEQGRQLGATIFLDLEFHRETKILDTKMIDLENGETICSQSYPMSQFMNLDYRLNTDFFNAFIKDLDACLKDLIPVAKMECVEVLEEKAGKANKLLIYCDAGCLVKRKDKLSIYTITEKTVGDKNIPYEDVIGEAIVNEVENSTFFNVKITKGEDVIYSLMKEKKTLYAKF